MLRPMTLCWPRGAGVVGSVPLPWLGPSWGPKIPVHPQEQVVSTPISFLIIAFGP